MTKAEQLGECVSLKDFNELISLEIEPQIGFFGGRYFSFADKSSLCLNDFVHKLDTLYKNLQEKDAETNGEAKLIAARINELDKLGSNKLMECSLVIRLLTAIKSIVGSFVLDRKAVLEQMNTPSQAAPSSASQEVKEPLEGGETLSEEEAEEFLAFICDHKELIGTEQEIILIERFSQLKSQLKKHSALVTLLCTSYEAPLNDLLNFLEKIEWPSKELKDSKLIEAIVSNGIFRDIATGKVWRQAPPSEGGFRIDLTQVFGARAFPLHPAKANPLMTITIKELLDYLWEVNKADQVAIIFDDNLDHPIPLHLILPLFSCFKEWKAGIALCFLTSRPKQETDTLVKEHPDLGLIFKSKRMLQKDSKIQP